MAFQLELSRGLFITLIVVFLIIAAIIFALVYLPAATIQLSPAVEARTLSQEITLSTQATTPDFVRFVLPARVVEKEIEDTKTIERSAGEVRDDFAKGTVKLINEQQEEQNLLPKTHLRHETAGVQFLTDAAVNIPPQSEVTVGVTAKVAGAVGNVPAGKFIVEKLPESTQKVIYGRSEQAFTGGLATGTAITEPEIIAAREQLTQSLRERAAGELTLAAGGAAIPPALVHIETLEEASSATPGSFATNFSVRSKIRARAFVADQNDLLSLTLIALRNSASSEEEFVAYEPNSFAPKIIRVDFERGQARVEGALTGTFAKKIEPSVLSPENIAGLGEKETIEYFKQFPSVGEVQVSFSPFWVKSIPSRQSATEITVQSPE